MKSQTTYTCTNAHITNEAPNFPYCVCGAWISSMSTKEIIEGCEVTKAVDFSYENKN